MFESSKTKLELSNCDSATLNACANLNPVSFIAAQMREVNELVPAWDFEINKIMTEWLENFGSIVRKISTRI